MNQQQTLDPKPMKSLSLANPSTIPDLDELWSSFHERLRRFVGRQVSRPEDAEDIVQEIFLRIHRGLEALEKVERLEGWIFRIARNAVIDFYRSAPRRREVPTAEFEPGALGTWEDDPEACCGREDLITALEPFVDRLPEDYRQAIRLTELGQLSQTAAAKQLGISVSGMKSRVQRARRQMREMFEACCRVEFDRRDRICCYERRDGENPCS